MQVERHPDVSLGYERIAADTTHNRADRPIKVGVVNVLMKYDNSLVALEQRRYFKGVEGIDFANEVQVEGVFCHRLEYLFHEAAAVGLDELIAPHSGVFCRQHSMIDHDMES